jgi:hypothetical protein
LTLAELEALEERRATELRYARFNAALVASAICNVNRAADAEPVSPFSFIPGFEPDPVDEAQRKRRRGAVQSIRVALSRLPDGVTTEAVLELKGKMIARLQGQGFEDAADIMREAFPEN